MKKSFLLFLALVALVILSSCAHRVDFQEFAKKVAETEARNPREIREHMELMLMLHPKMDKSTKESIRQLLLTHFDEHKKLRDEESKVIQVLLEKSLDAPDFKNHQHNGLAELNKLYSLKARNVSQLVEKIQAVTVGIVERRAVHRELQMLLNELR